MDSKGTTAGGQVSPVLIYQRASRFVVKKTPKNRVQLAPADHPIQPLRPNSARFYSRIYQYDSAFYDTRGRAR